MSLPHRSRATPGRQLAQPARTTLRRKLRRTDPGSTGSASGRAPTAASQPGPLTGRAFHDLVSPLLELVSKLSGLDTAFITHIDWEEQRQQVLVARNEHEPLVNEGDAVAWQDSMCRRIFLSGTSWSSDVGADFPDSIGARTLGLGTFFALPINAGTITVGTLCGASSHKQAIDPGTMDLVNLVAKAMSVQYRAELLRYHAEQRASQAEQAAATAMARASELETNVVELHSQATTDPLTQLTNRRGFLAGYERQLAGSGRLHLPLGLLMLDIDSFKQVNDRYGHPAGDQVLQALASSILTTVRASDIVGRIGGDEFAVSAGGADTSTCHLLAARIQSAFTSATGAFGAPCTVSIGIASTTATSHQHLMVAADQALYQSKASGPGRITVWTGDPVGDPGSSTSLAGTDHPPALSGSGHAPTPPSAPSAPSALSAADWESGTGDPSGSHPAPTFR